MASTSSAAETSSASSVSSAPKSTLLRLNAKKSEATSQTGAKNASIGLRKTSNPPPWRNCIYAFLVSPLIVSYMTTAISASDQVALNSACRCDEPVPFPVLCQCCGSISSGVRRSYRGSFLTQRIFGVWSSLVSRKRPCRNFLDYPSIVLRGGAVPLTSQPLIDTKSVSLALRLTCETNRRLQRGILDKRSLRTPAKTHPATIGMDSSLSMVPHQEVTAHLQPQQQTMMSTSTSHTIRTVSDEELMKERLNEELTVFHSFQRMEPDSNNNHGNTSEQISRPSLEMLQWGPELQPYLKTLLCAIGLDEEGSSGSSYIVHNTANIKQQQPVEDELQIFLSLTLMYLDRSTNTPHHVDLLTGQFWCPPCPHLLPQTVHRLLLTAMSFAAKNLSGDKSVSSKLRDAANSLLDEKQVISQNDMEAMENWMLNALRGRTGMQVHQNDLMWQITPEEISIFLRNWGRLFYPQRLAIHDHTRIDHLERIWRGQSDQFGINHGHGNYWSDQVPLTEFPFNPEQYSQNQLTQRQYNEQL